MDISSFRRDPHAMRDGEWIDPGPEFGGIQVKVRHLGYEFADAQARRLRLASRLAGGEDRLNAEQRARANIEAMTEIGLIDVRGLSEDGAPVTRDRFAELLLEPAMGELVNMVFRACGDVGRRRDAELADAVGNSPPASANT